jgi:hypothetical protein
MIMKSHQIPLNPIKIPTVSIESSISAPHHGTPFFRNQWVHGAERQKAISPYGETNKTW